MNGPRDGAGRATLAALLAAGGGLLAWAVVFSLLYAVQGLACSSQLPPAWRGAAGPWRAVLVAIWLGGLAFVGVLGIRAGWPRRDLPLLRRLASFSALVGGASVMVTGLPVLGTSLCGE
jgi:hypothetical protein